MAQVLWNADTPCAESPTKWLTCCVYTLSYRGVYVHVFHRYYGTLAIGTPPVSFNVLLDMGLAWVPCPPRCIKPIRPTAIYGCSERPAAPCAMVFPCTTHPLPRLSKTHPLPSPHNMGCTAEYPGTSPQRPLKWLASPLHPRVSVRPQQPNHLSWPHAGYNMHIGVIDIASLDMPLFAPVSGFLGLAWETLAVSQRMPFWQALASSGALDSPLFAIQLTRWGLRLFSVWRSVDPEA